jgi:hypothetical protein
MDDLPVVGDPILSSAYRCYALDSGQRVMFQSLHDGGSARGAGRGAVAAEGLCPLEVEEDAPFEVQAAATSPSSVIRDTVTSAICHFVSVPCVSSAAAAAG